MEKIKTSMLITIFALALLIAVSAVPDNATAHWGDDCIIGESGESCVEGGVEADADYDCVPIEWGPIFCGP